LREGSIQAQIGLVVALTSLLMIAHEAIHGMVMLGLWACFGPWAGYLILPLALHLGGCVGDGFAAWRVLHEPPGTEYEDLRDGIRFHRMPRLTMAAPRERH
jgi:hypothetical protein